METDLEYLGVITAVSDAVVSDLGIANPQYEGVIKVNKDMVSFSKKSANACVKIDSLLIRPSDAIERIIRFSTIDLKRAYTSFLNDPSTASMFKEALNTNVQPASTVGINLRTNNNNQRYIFYNKKASIGFNIFNSHPLSIEAHTDADVMILMAIFLKQNSLWHNKGGLMYDQFDYTKMFFNQNKTTTTPFFTHELASCIPVEKRKAGDAPSINLAAANNVIGLQNDQCRHASSSYINLYSDNQSFCVSCFCSMFFVASGTVMFKNKTGLQEWIDETNQRFTDKRLIEHLNILASVECSSKIEYDYKFWNLINSLDVRRKKLLPTMDTGLLYANMNSFGKMLLVMMQNCFIVTDMGKVKGKWFDLDYMGPNLWKFQITSYREEHFETFADMACIETLRRLPADGEPIVSRMVFKTYCRGENLSLAYEIVSDVSQTVNHMRLNTEGRTFFFKDGKLCSSAEASGDEVLLSLEVTGYRPNRAQNNINSNRVSARVMRILGSREGARVWKCQTEKCILVEDLSPSNGNASYDAMERMSTLNKIFYYDIETNTTKCSASDATITSICGSLCTGGDVDGGERVIFALAAGGVEPAELVQCIREEYSCQGDLITDYPPQKIYAFSTEYELLLAFSAYMREAKPHVFCGWNSKSFDDPFVFYRMVHYLRNERDPQKRVALATDNGLFNFEPFMTTKEGSGWPMLCRAFYGDTSAAAAAHDNMSYIDHQRRKQGGGGDVIDINAILGGCCKAVRLDMKEVCAKAYENLPEYNLNAVLVKVSEMGDRMAILKDPIDVAKQLLGYMSLRTAKEQAPVHKYCSKDAYVVGVIDISVNKGGEIRRLCYDSTLIESVVTANLPTPLCISDGAICRSMGRERALKRGNGIRKHSMATETKGGMVSQPMVDSVCLQTVDMSSLYPSTMCQYNLCTSTFVTHMQIINLRDRVAMSYLAAASSDNDILDAVDKANAYILNHYRPIDIIVNSWRRESTDKIKRTFLEKKLNVFWDEKKNDGGHREWCRDRPPNFSITAAGMEYFPEYDCNLDLQRAANVNDDMHINPSDLEYMVPALVVMVQEDPGLAAHVTCGTCTTTEGLLAMLDADFDRETDQKIKARLYSYVGTDSDPDWVVDNALDRQITSAVVDLLDRILRRVNAFDSANDRTLKKWAARMINVGSFVRAWNAKRDVLKGVIPVLQADYKVDRTVMQQKAKIFATIDPKKAELNKVGEKTAKLCMNSIYGCLGLRANQSRKNVGASEAPGREQGAGGGTRHSPTANQITAVSRCVFGNIACAIQQALPNAKQVYGDTDSVFCNYNIPGDGGNRSLFMRDDGRLVYRIDTIMKNKIANFLPLFINAATKGIKFDERRDAGVPFMKIAHERLAFLAFLFAKKTYHMIHLNEGTKGSDAILACAQRDSIEKFTRVIDCPEEYKNYVIAHNSRLILAAAANDEKLNAFLKKEGAIDQESLKMWFTISDQWLEVDADTLYSLYASRMLDVENGNWIDWRTSRPIERGTHFYEAVTQAAESFTLYRKGMFVKKGIPASTKLKSLQSLFIRNLPKHLFDKASEYRNGIEHHVQNCASFEVSPFMTITSSRVGKYKANEKQKLPNPMAMMLHNHIHPSDPILPAEKFLTVTAVSAWAISSDRRKVPTGYFDNKCVKWDADTMRGLVPGSVVKSLSVVPNTIRTVMEMVRSDAKNIESVIEECVNALTTASTGTSGFSFKKRALCFSTGILCSDTLIRAILKNKEEKEEEEEEATVNEPDKMKIVSTALAKHSLGKIRDRILNCMVHDKMYRNDNIKTLDLKQLMCDKLRVDNRVYEQLCNLVDQLEISKNIMAKKGKERVSTLDEMIAAVKIDFDRVVDICASRMVQHCKKCPVIRPDDNADCLFKKVLDLLMGKVKCTATCINATCQSLDFVLLCTLALREVNRRRRTNEFDVSMTDYNTEEMVKIAFGPRFNQTLDAVVFLFDEPVAPMNKTQINKTIRNGASSLTTGLVYNSDDGKFFGGLMDRAGIIEESLLQGGSVVELPFMTGIYYREAVELTVSRLCENRILKELLMEKNSG